MGVRYTVRLSSQSQSALKCELSGAGIKQTVVEILPKSGGHKLGGNLGQWTICVFKCRFQVFFWAQDISLVVFGLGGYHIHLTSF